MFETEEYQKLRQILIDLFNEYENSRKILQQDTENQSDGLSKDGLKSLERRISLIKENKYLLAIAGESNSGKSSFINGILGKSILPVASLQCTSTIIEIINTNNKENNKEIYLRTTYGDTKEKKWNNISDIQAKLKEIAEIPEEYRYLPIQQLNKYLIENKPERIDDANIQDLLPELENPKQIPTIDFQKLIKDYLNDYRDLSNIPTKIEVGYPLELNFTNLRIVDTPGVNARGGFQHATLEYICNANAVIVVHHLNNIASKYLEDFLNEKIPNQAKKNVFMVLTHKSSFVEEEIKQKIQEAKDLFQERRDEEQSIFVGIKEGRILVIDSMLKIIYDEILTDNDIDIREKCKTDEKIKKLITPYLFDYKDNLESIKEAVYRDSNFKLLEKLLKEFSEIAIKEEIISIANIIADAYTEQKKIYKETVELTENKFNKSKEEFAIEIDNRKEILEKFKAELNTFSTSRGQKYAGLNSETEAEFNNLKDKYLKKTEILWSAEISEASDLEDKIRKILIDFNSDCKQKFSDRQSSLSQDYKNKMEELEIEFQQQANIPIPKFDIEEMMKKNLEESYNMIKIPGNKTKNAFVGGLFGGAYGAGCGLLVGGPVGAVIGGMVLGSTVGLGAWAEGESPAELRVLNVPSYKYSLIDEIKSAIPFITVKIVDLNGGLFNKYDQNFRNKLKDAIEERQKAYDDLEKKDKENQESHKIQMQLLQSRLDFIKDQANLIKELMCSF